MSTILDFLKSVAGICRTSPLKPDLWELHGNRVIIRLHDVPELRLPGDAVYLEGKGLRNPILVVRKDDGEYLSVANRCTHFGRKLDPVPGEPLLRCCSVGRSTFDHDGNRLGGPAGKPLEVYRVELTNGELLIDLQ